MTAPTEAIARLTAFEDRVDSGYVNALRKCYDPGATVGSDGLNRAVSALRADLRTLLAELAEARKSIADALALTRVQNSNEVYGDLATTASEATRDPIAPAPREEEIAKIIDPDGFSGAPQPMPIRLTPTDTSYSV